MTSGSKKRKRASDSGKRKNTRKALASPELSSWQLDVLETVRSSPLARDLVFGGGAALSAVYLHHRTSIDLDFFVARELREGDLLKLKRSLTIEGVLSDEHIHGPHRSLVLRVDQEPLGKIDFAYQPHDPLDRRKVWKGFKVESLLDMTANKVQTVLTRFQPRDYVDLYFLLREGPERDLERLLELVREKFESGADHFALANRLMAGRMIEDLPAMIRPLDIEDLRQFFWDLARTLIRKG